LQFEPQRAADIWKNSGRPDLIQKIKDKLLKMGLTTEEVACIDKELCEIAASNSNKWPEGSKSEMLLKKQDLIAFLFARVDYRRTAGKVGGPGPPPSPTTPGGGYEEEDKCKAFEDWKTKWHKANPADTYTLEGLKKLYLANMCAVCLEVFAAITLHPPSN
jgi:hypothetical protein